MTPPRQRLSKLAANPSWVVFAHNAQFERYVWQHIMGPQYGWPSIPLVPVALLAGESTGGGPTCGTGERRCGARA